MMLITGDDDGGGGGSGVIRLNIGITIILSRRLLYLPNVATRLLCSHLSKYPELPFCKQPVPTNTRRAKRAAGPLTQKQ